MLMAGIKEEFEQYVHNAKLGPYIEDKCNQYLSLTESFTKEFKFHPRESRVSFKLYGRSITMSLDVFRGVCVKFHFGVCWTNHQGLSMSYF
jgi:hypothetical protein